MLKKVAIAGCILAVVVSFLSHRLTLHAADAYAVSILEVPSSTLTVACGIDIVGRVVGYYVDGSGTHGFLFSNGSYSTIDVPGAGWTTALGISSTGQIVGGFGPTDAPTGRHGFLLSGGSYSTFDVPGSIDTLARGVNNRGQIVGEYTGPNGIRHGFRLSGGTYATIELPQSGTGAANGINDSGQIVGLAGSGPGATGFLLDGSLYTKIEFPNSNYTELLGLNNVGDLVGQIDRALPPFRGFRRNGSSDAVINLPDFPSSWDARGINDLGQIVGAITNKDGTTRGYQATPGALKPGQPSYGAITLVSNAPGGIGPAGPPGPAGPQGPPGPAGPSSSSSARRGGNILTDTRDVVRGAISSLHRAANQSGYVQKAIEDITAVQGDVTAAITYSNMHPNAAGSEPRPVTEPNFTPPARPAPNRNVMLEGALSGLQNAYGLLAQAPGGDLGGFRAKANNDIAIAARDLITAMNAANAGFLEDRRRKD